MDVGYLKKINRIILIMLILSILTGCQSNRRTIHVFYARTCQECQLFEKHFIPEIEEFVEVKMYDIDQLESITLYRSYLSELEGIDNSLYDIPMTPFIYMENGFGAVGYTETMKDIYIQLIQEEINNEKHKDVPSGVWLSKEE